MRGAARIAAGAALAALLTGVAAGPVAAAERKPSPAVLAKLQELEDYQAIQTLLAHYIVVEDDGDWKTYSNLFAKKGELVFQKNDWVGPERIYAGMQAAADAPNSVLKTRGLRHSTSNVDIQIDGDHAHVTSRWIVMSRQPDGRPLVGATGRNEDTMVREDGEWKFERRLIYTDFPFDDPLANQAAKR